MKKQILAIVAKSGFELMHYKTERSDMGCQCYEVQIKVGGKTYCFNDSYFVGSGTKNSIIISFNDFIKEVKTNVKTRIFSDLCKPLMRYLSDNHHPHCTVILTSTNAELVEGVMAVNKSVS